MSLVAKELIFDNDGLIPAIIQDNTSGKVLMLAYMNEQSLLKTIKTKETWFFSRSRQELWNKGATSGNKQQVKNISYDCDGDAILIEVEQLGVACHTGEISCFCNSIDKQNNTSREIIYDLIKVINKRAKDRSEDSYTTYLFDKGIDKVLKKIGEEASEVIIGAKNENKEELTWELADLIYHSLVLMEMTDVTITDLKDELVKRHIQKRGVK